MTSPNALTGRVTITIDGVTYKSLKGAKLTNAGMLSRSGVKGSGLHGFTTDDEFPTVDVEFAHGKGLSIAKLTAIEDSSLTFDCDSGVVYVLTGVFFAKDQGVTGGDGKYGLQLMGMTCDDSEAD